VSIDDDDTSAASRDLYGVYNRSAVPVVPKPLSPASLKLRAALLVAAHNMLEESDAPIELRKVAERIGKSRTAPYLVFGKTEEGGGLEALLVAVAADGFEKLLSTLYESRSAAADPEVELTRVALAYLSFARANPRLFRLMFGPEAARAVAEGGPYPSQRPEVPRLVRARREADDLFRQLVENCQRVNAIGPGDSRTFAIGVWTSLHGAAMLLLDGQLGLAGKEPGPAEIAALVSGLLIHNTALHITDAVNAFGEAQLAKGLPSVVPPTEGPSRVRGALARSPVLRRVRQVRQLFEGCRILWVADRPELSAAEQRALESLGAEVARARDTLGALAELHRAKQFDLILSDIGRPDSRTAGTDELPLIKRAAPNTPVIFYVDVLDPRTSRPAGSAGITDDPSELFNLILDVLERKRI
jgi:CheY-like chemotaxis protein/AcrR family transcriptional regulator